jgi:hypothetical protein
LAILEWLKSSIRSRRGNKRETMEDHMAHIDTHAHTVDFDWVLEVEHNLVSHARPVLVEVPQLLARKGDIRELRMMTTVVMVKEWHAHRTDLSSTGNSHGGGGGWEKPITLGRLIRDDPPACP